MQKGRKNMKLKEWLEEDRIQNIYYGNPLLAEKMPETAEYKQIMAKRKKLYDKLITSNVAIEKYLGQYNECSLIKEGIEAEFEFRLGFRTAICLIMQSLEKEI